MFQGNQVSLPQCEFFMLLDEREDFELLAERSIRFPDGNGGILDQYDGDTDNSKALSVARLHCLRELDPERGPLNMQTLFNDRRFRFNPELISDVSYFHGAQPAHEIHFDCLIDFACEPSIGLNGKPSPQTGAYYFVSDEWRDAIESLEPGVHQFFAHVVEFSTTEIDDHFIFRDCVELDFIDDEKSTPEAIVARRDVLHGHHWVKQKRLRRSFVSLELAEKLLPLLPRSVLAETVRFDPLKLI